MDLQITVRKLYITISFHFNCRCYYLIVEMKINVGQISTFDVAKRVAKCWFKNKYFSKIVGKY